MPATSHYLCDHVAAAKLFGELFGCWPGLTGAIGAFEKDYRHIQRVAVISHEYPILSVGSVQTKSNSQWFAICRRGSELPPDCIENRLLFSLNARKDAA